MKCPQCQAENEAGARYCGNCGSPLPQQPATRPKAGNKIHCSRCGTPNPPDSTFCENCGNRLDRQGGPVPATRSSRSAAAAVPVTRTKPAPAQPAVKPQQEVQPTSGALWLLPIFFAWVGGLIGFVVARDRDRKKANGLLILGIAMTVAWPVVWLIIAFIVSSPTFVNFG